MIDFLITLYVHKMKILNEIVIQGVQDYFFKCRVLHLLKMIFKMGKKKHKDDPPPDPDSLQVFNRKVSFNLTVNIWEQ